MNFFATKTTKAHSKYWKNRKIDWTKDYLSTWNHPHRYLISSILKKITWVSLIEIGCGAGANLMNLIKTNTDSRPMQLGGIDINADAIKVAEENFKGGVFKVGPADDLMMSDKSTDMALTDMCLIYVGPRKIKKHLQELKRITRNRVVLCEFHHKSFWRRLKLKVETGYNMYDYDKLLTKLGFYDISIYKIPDELWPDVKNPDIRHIIVARVPKRG